MLNIEINKYINKSKQIYDLKLSLPENAVKFSLAVIRFKTEWISDISETNYIGATHRINPC
jgi:hypothetical protein